MKYIILFYFLSLSIITNAQTQKEFTIKTSYIITPLIDNLQAQLNVLQSQISILTSDP